MRWPIGTDCPTCGVAMWETQSVAWMCTSPICPTGATVYRKPERKTPEIDKKPGDLCYAKRAQQVGQGRKPVSGWLNPSHPGYQRFIENPNARCVVGRHRVASNLDLWFEIDGKYICQDHVLAVVALFDASRGNPGISNHELVKAAAERDKQRRQKARAEDMRRTGTRDPGWIYYIRMGEHIKIGYAADVTRRMKAYPPSAELLAVPPGTLEMEKELHRQFRAFLDKGREWFTPGPSLMEHIDATRTKFGDPAMFAHRYRRAKRSA